MITPHSLGLTVFVTLAFCFQLPVNGRAETLYVDSRNGRDTNPGTAEQSLQTLGQVAAVVNAKTAREATTEQFEFHHNIVTGSEYFWMRKRGTPKTDRVQDCVVTGNAYYSGYGLATGATGPTGPEINFAEERVAKDQAVTLETNRALKGYLHALPGTPGSHLGAGLFMK